MTSATANKNVAPALPPIHPGEILADRLGRYFGTTAQVWLNLQINYDLEVASRELADKIKRIHPLAA